MTFDKPRVSVILPTYNAAKFVGRAVASVVAQEGIGPIEIIATDDASRDNTVEVLKRLARKFPSLTVIENAVNGGPSARRNQAIAAARGDWLAVLDADDAFAPGRLERLVICAEEARLDAIADLPLLYDLTAGCAEPKQPTADGKLDPITLRALVDPSAGAGIDLGLLKPVFRRDLGQSGMWHYPEGVRHGEDFELYFRALNAGVAFGLLREQHYIFSTRIGAVSQAHSQGSVTRLDFLGLAAQARRLQAELTDPELIAMMEQRVVNARRSNRLHGWTVLRNGEFRSFATWLRRDPRNLDEVRRIVWAKAMGHRGLPD